MAEAELYAPVKRFLEAQGYTVKGEIGACDVVAVRDGDEPVVVELKERLTLSLLLQAVDRFTVSDAVYVAFPVGPGRGGAWRSRRKAVLRLFRRLGLGLLTVSSAGRVEPVLDPVSTRPRPSRVRRARLLKEFAERVGDPETGGSAPRPRLTAYRQDALRCAMILDGAAETSLRELRSRTGILRAGAILRDNHYGWFDRVRRGHYALSPKGRQALQEWAGELSRL